MFGIEVLQKKYINGYKIEEVYDNKENYLYVTLNDKICYSNNFNDVVKKMRNASNKINNIIKEVKE